MDLILLFKALIMGIVEGITEFLPISSTGHLILTGDLLDFLGKTERDAFVVFIQLGAMLAVVWEYRVKLFGAVRQARHDAGARRFLSNILIAFIPAAVIGKLLDEPIEKLLFFPVPVAMAFIVGGFIILWAERRKHTVTIESVDDMTWKDALKVGLCQCVALIPGTSRSGATIIGGLFLGMSRKAAAEFSFFLGVPTLGAASIYKLLKLHNEGGASLLAHADVFAVGFVASFIFAFFAIRALIRYVVRHDFTVFAWYRIAFGAVVLATAWSGIVHWGA